MHKLRFCSPSWHQKRLDRFPLYCESLKLGHAIYSIFFARRNWSRSVIFPPYAGSRHGCMCQHRYPASWALPVGASLWLLQVLQREISPRPRAAGAQLHCSWCSNASLLQLLAGKDKLKKDPEGWGSFSGLLSRNLKLLAAQRFFKRSEVTQKPEIYWFSAGMGLPDSCWSCRRARSAWERLEKEPVLPTSPLTTPRGAVGFLGALWLVRYNSGWVLGCQQWGWHQGAQPGWKPPRRQTRDLAGRASRCGFPKMFFFFPLLPIWRSFLPCTEENVTQETSFLQTLSLQAGSTPQ